MLVCCSLEIIFKNIFYGFFFGKKIILIFSLKRSVNYAISRKIQLTFAWIFLEISFGSPKSPAIGISL